MKRRLLFASGIVAALGLIFLLVVGQSYRERRLLLKWETKWDWTLSWRANQERRRRELHEMAPVALRVLRKDLNYDPIVASWLAKAPGWFPSTLYGREGGRWPPQVRAEAARKLALLGPDASASLPELIQRTHDPYEGLQLAAALAIGSIGENNAQARAALSNLSTNNHPQVAGSAAFALWQLDPSDLAAQKQLEKRLDADVLVCIAEPLARMNSRAKPLIPALSDTFQEIKSMTSKVNMAHTLWCITGDAKEPLALIQFFAEEWDQSSRHPAPGAAQSRGLSHLASAALVFGDIPECRAALRPILKGMLKAEPAIGRQAAEHWLSELDETDAEHRR